MTRTKVADQRLSLKQWFAWGGSVSRAQKTWLWSLFSLMFRWVNLGWACNPIENQYLVSGQLEKKSQLTSVSCRLEPTIWSRDVGQRSPCFGRCQLIKTWMSISKMYAVTSMILVTLAYMEGWTYVCMYVRTVDTIKITRVVNLPLEFVNVGCKKLITWSAKKSSHDIKKLSCGSCKARWRSWHSTRNTFFGSPV